MANNTMNKIKKPTFYDFPAPAKINLFLHVVGQQANGYHELETLFQFLTLADTLSIAKTDDQKIKLLTPFAGVVEQDNLIVKAALLLQQATNTSFGAQLAINKIIPMGGGLGGGSSNAATVLMALNALWQTQLSTEQLCQLGIQLGADVPIFIYGKAAFAQGIGEQFTSATPPQAWYLITKPACSISTQSIFQAASLCRNTSKLKQAKFESINDIDALRNDCEAVVIKQHPEVAKLYAWLIEYAPTRMTGTGSCLFSRFDTQSAAEKCQQSLTSSVQSFVTKAVNKSPLINVIQRFK